MFDPLDVTPLRIADAYRITPRHYPDRRGYFYEAFRADVLSDAIGYPFQVRQANYSSSCRGTVRGIHSTKVPPGQAKLVTCVRGAVMDVVVDLRIGSPTFGEFECTRQDADEGISVYMADGLGHAFVALTDDACMNYLCSEVYVPGTMIEVNPLDPEIGIPWNTESAPVMSDKDAAAPGIAEAAARGLLPHIDDCRDHYSALQLLS